MSRWRVVFVKEYYSFNVLDEDDRLVCTTYSDTPLDHKNATLIGSAPDMLDALDAALAADELLEEYEEAVRTYDPDARKKWKAWKKVRDDAVAKRRKIVYGDVE